MEPIASSSGVNWSNGVVQDESSEEDSWSDRDCSFSECFADNDRIPEIFTGELYDSNRVEPEFNNCKRLNDKDYENMTFEEFMEAVKLGHLPAVKFHLQPDKPSSGATNAKKKGNDKEKQSSPTVSSQRSVTVTSKSSCSRSAKTACTFTECEKACLNIKAVSSPGNPGEMKFHIQQKANLEFRDNHGQTALILAAERGHTKIVEILLNAGANIEAQTFTRDTSLTLACFRNRFEVVQLLLKKNANKEHRNISDYTPLALAAAAGSAKLVSLLINNGAEINSRTGSRHGVTPLMLSSITGRFDITKLLLDKGADIHAKIVCNWNTALTLACYKGRHEVVDLLIKRKANIEHRAKSGLTPLMEAATGGFLRVGKLLIEKGADVNAAPVRDTRDTALIMAVDNGHYSFVELLLKKGAMVDARIRPGCTSFWMACHHGYLEIAKLLFKYNADVDSRDYHNTSCTLTAYRRGHVNLIRWILEYIQQFPSEEEIMSYMWVVRSNPDLLNRCRQCAIFINQAKDKHEVEANRNAIILLEEEEKERERERNKRLAAQRKKERKKMKKQKQSSANRQDNVDDTMSEAQLENVGNEATTSKTVLDKNNHTRKFLVDSPVEQQQQPTNSFSMEKQLLKVEDDVMCKQASEVNKNAYKNKNKKLQGESEVKELKQTVTKTYEILEKGYQKPNRTEVFSKNIVKINEGESFENKNMNEEIEMLTYPGIGPTKEDDGWKQVTSKRCSSTFKKVSVPSTAISRVIGKGGCNIMAIREATGAHIEVEKFRKEVQRDRVVQIKGNAEAVKLAQDLITALIKDENADIKKLLSGTTRVMNRKDYSVSPIRRATTMSTPVGQFPVTGTVTSMNNVLNRRNGSNATLQNTSNVPMTVHNYAKLSSPLEGSARNSGGFEGSQCSSTSRGSPPGSNICRNGSSPDINYRGTCSDNKWTSHSGNDSFSAKPVHLPGSLKEDTAQKLSYASPNNLMQSRELSSSTFNELRSNENMRDTMYSAYKPLMSAEFPPLPSPNDNAPALCNSQDSAKTRIETSNGSESRLQLQPAEAVAKQTVQSQSNRPMTNIDSLADGIIRENKEDLESNFMNRDQLENTSCEEYKLYNQIPGTLLTNSNQTSVVDTLQFSFLPHQAVLEPKDLRTAEYPKQLRAPLEYYCGTDGTNKISPITNHGFTQRMNSDSMAASYVTNSAVFPSHDQIMHAGNSMFQQQNESSSSQPPTVAPSSISGVGMRRQNIDFMFQKNGLDYRSLGVPEQMQHRLTHTTESADIHDSTCGPSIIDRVSEAPYPAVPGYNIMDQDDFLYSMESGNNRLSRGYYLPPSGLERQQQSQIGHSYDSNLMGQQALLPNDKFLMEPMCRYSADCGGQYSGSTNSYNSNPYFASGAHQALTTAPQRLSHQQVEQQLGETESVFEYDQCPNQMRETEIPAVSSGSDNFYDDDDCLTSLDIVNILRRVELGANSVSLNSSLPPKESKLDKPEKKILPIGWERERMLQSFCENQRRLRAGRNIQNLENRGPFVNVQDAIDAGPLPQQIQIPPSSVYQRNLLHNRTPIRDGGVFLQSSSMGSLNSQEQKTPLTLGRYGSPAARETVGFSAMDEMDNKKFLRDTLDQSLLSRKHAMLANAGIGRGDDNMIYHGFQRYPTQ